MSHDPAASIGPGFEHPFIDVDEQRSEPVPHRYVHGGFDGTETRFSFYLPSAEQYEGRFFQHVTPVPDSENLAQTERGREGKIDFAIASGAYFVETNGGGANFARPELGGDMTVAAFRANAAAAEFSRTVATEMYGGRRPFGYLYGGSGGGFRTMGAAENTRGVWDGYVPYVIGSPLAIPNVFTVRMHAMRILWHKFDIIVDAYAPGGSGDPFPLLTHEEADALREVTRMGFPPRSWFGWKTMGAHAFSVLYGGLAMIDPGYFDDFWSVEGYLGADPASSVHRDRLQWRVEVAGVIRGEEKAESHGPRGGVDQAFREPASDSGHIVGVRLAFSAPLDAQLADLTVASGPLQGTRLVLASVIGDVALIDIPGAGHALEGLQPGDTVLIDNSNVLAAQIYHRHQVPTPDFAVWDQFRAADGSPLYPQRPMLVGPLMAMGASGTVQSGAIDGRMIVVSCLNDREAFPWQADWYAGKVREHLGDEFDDRFRLWFVEHGLHGDTDRQEHPTRAVSYLGVLHEALRQLAAWVERGEEPVASTNYRVVDGQIEVPATADARLGVQPVAALTASASDRIDVAPGQEVTLHLEAESPVGAGRIVGVEWDLDGDGEFDTTDEITAADRVSQRRAVAFEAPGTYFVTARVAAQADGDPASPWARVENLASVRVSVS